MKILAIDSSGMVASVAIIEDDLLIGEYTLNHKKTHSQTLVPMLNELKNMLQLELDTIDGIAVASGPGSFTGLRIGSATAKGLGLALNIPIIEVPTLEGMAFQLFGSECLICPMLDARRNQVYTGVYTFRTIEGKYEFQTILEQTAVNIDDIIRELNEYGKEVILLGDGVPVYADMIQTTLKVPYKIAKAHLNRQRAASVGALAIEYFNKDKGKIISARDHKPEYLRMSQAERERLEKNEEKKS